MIMASKFTEIGNSGLVQYGGLVTDDFLNELKGLKKFQVYKEMSMNDSMIGGILFIIEMIIKQVDWKVEGDSKEDALFLDECMNDMSHTWGDFISEVLSMLPYGFSYFETVYKQRSGDQKEGSEKSKYNDGKIGWRKQSIRPQDTLLEWRFDKEGGIEGFVQQNPNNYTKVFIPIEKSLLFRTSTFKNNPEGRSILRKTYRSWYLKKHIENMEAIGIERDLAGFPLMRVPSDIIGDSVSPEQKATYQECQRIVKNIKIDEQTGVILPSDSDENGNYMYDLTLIASNGAKSFDTDKVIRRYEQRIAISMLADFMLLGHENSGSWALSSDKTEIFTTALGSYLDIITSTFNRYAVSRLFEVNGMAREVYPEIKFVNIEKINLEEISNYIQKLSSSGMPIFPNTELENELLGNIGFLKEDIE